MNAKRCALAGIVVLFSTSLLCADTYEVLHEFGLTLPVGRAHSELILGSDGRLYGTTVYEGQHGLGTVFAVEIDGGGFIVLHVFDGSVADGARPSAALIEGSDHRLYGTAASGGQHGKGVVFSLELNGGGFTVLHHFEGTTADGAQPMAALLEASDNRLYGTTVNAGAHGAGTLFALEANGTGFEVIHDFRRAADDGAHPEAGVVEGSNGRLYGTTRVGGEMDYGTVFGVDKDGAGFAVVHSYQGTDGAYPDTAVFDFSTAIPWRDGLFATTPSGGRWNGGTLFWEPEYGSSWWVWDSFWPERGIAPVGALVYGSGDLLWGATSAGGRYGFGTLFTWDPYDPHSLASVCFDFQEATSVGGNPTAGLLAVWYQAPSPGCLYGTTSTGGLHGAGTVFELCRWGTGMRVLHDFESPPSRNGARPMADLVLGSDDRLYGTTYRGGASDVGTVFALDTSGAVFTVLHEFEQTTTDGAFPQAGLVEAESGRLLGMTPVGGENDLGTVYAVGTDGAGFDVLFDFEFPSGSTTEKHSTLIRGADGRLYGTTPYGGLYHDGDPRGDGTVFAVEADGTGFVVLHNFQWGQPDDGSYPYAALLQGADGRLYGTTYYGGQYDNGTVFALEPDGTGFVVLHDFQDGVAGNGGFPCAPLVQGTDGRLYGTTEEGGPYSDYGYGTVFAIEPDGGGFVVLHDFQWGVADNGAYPWSGVTFGRDGKLYGTTAYGGEFGAGTVYVIDPAGVDDFEIVHSFDRTRGATPSAGLTKGPDGALYGTAYGGGAGDGGVVYRLFVNSVPELAPIGDQAVPEGATLELWLSATDADGDGLEFSMDGGTAPPGASLDPGTGVFSYTPGYEVSSSAGNTSFDLVFRVDDGLTGQTSEMVRITVLDVAGGTLPGSDVTVDPVDPTTGTSPVSVTFDEVTEVGETTVVTTSDGEPPDTGFMIVNDSYIEVSTDATILPPIHLCFSYASYGLNAEQEGALRVLHLVHLDGLLTNGMTCGDVAGCWEDITDPDLPPEHPNPDTLSDVICGTCSSLSLFAIVQGVEVVAGVDPVPVGEVVTASLDAGSSEAVDSGFWIWGDGAVSGATVTDGSVAGSHLYSRAGIYVPHLTLWKEGREIGSADFKYVVVYDPNGGFVTGGGWIESPAGAFVDEPTLTGRANFGFVAKYEPGATVPTGTTEFRFKAAGLDFHSTSYQWLVVAGAKAKYKGVGRVNGTIGYGFMISAVDGQILGGGGQDKFRIKIWEVATEEVVYDNQLEAPEDADPTTMLGSGSIVIHK